MGKAFGFQSRRYGFKSRSDHANICDGCDAAVCDHYRINLLVTISTARTDCCSYETDEAGAVNAGAATAEEAEDSDRSADENEDGGELLKEREESGRRHGPQQVDVDGRLRIDVHPETDPEHRTAAHLLTTSTTSITRPVSSRTGDRLRAGILSRYVTSQLGQLSLASLRGRLIEYQLRLG